MTRTRGASTAALAAALAVVAVTVICWRRQASRSNEEDKNRKNKKETQKETIAASLPISPAVQHTFAECATRIRHVRHLSNTEKLRLYALYKQATVGNAPETLSASMASASWNIMAAHAKYAAWRQLHGMDPAGACYQYIAMAQIHLEHQSNNDEDDDLDRSTEHADYRTSHNQEQEEETTPKNVANSPATGGLGVTVSRPVLLGASDDYNDENDSSLPARFFRAAASNDLGAVRDLLQTHSTTLNVNHKDSVGQTALHMAADHGATSVMEYLLEKYKGIINANAADNDGISVLQTAVIAGQINACRLLLKHGADPDQPDDDGDTPRTCAADDPELLQLFAYQ